MPIPNFSDLASDPYLRSAADLSFKFADIAARICTSNPQLDIEAKTVAAIAHVVAIAYQAELSKIR